MILRLTQKLNQKVGAGKLGEMPLDENPLADWSCHLFTADGTQYIIVSNTPSLYSCVMFGRGITDDSQLITRALASIREFMEDDGLGRVYHQMVAPSSATVSFAKALNRKITGSIKELVGTAQHWLVEDEIAPHELGFKLNDILLSALAADKAAGYGRPKRSAAAFAQRGLTEGSTGKKMHRRPKGVLDLRLRLHKNLLRCLVEVPKECRTEPALRVRFFAAVPPAGEFLSPSIQLPLIAGERGAREE